MPPARTAFYPLPTMPGTALSPPLRLDWLVHAAHLSGKTFHLGVALLTLAATRRVSGVRLTRRAMAGWSLSRDAVYDGLRRLEAADLVRVWRPPGRSPQIVLLEPGRDRALDLRLPRR